MAEFTLPDLGEGLQDAEILEWKIQEGQKVEVDQLVLVVETAKAVVELPSPVQTTILKLSVKEGDSVAVGQVLFEYEGEPVKASSREAKKTRESVSVVGELASVTGEKADLYEGFSLEVEGNNKQESFVNKNRRNEKARHSAPPSIVAFAKKLGLDSRLDEHEYGELTHHELLKIYETKLLPSKQLLKGVTQGNNKNEIVKLTGARKVMAQSMTKSHQHIPSVTLFDDAAISHWTMDEDITLRLIKAIVSAAHEVPLLNAWFDEETLSVQMFEDIHLGVAVNAKQGLFVPVIRKIQNLDGPKIRKIMDKMIQEVGDRTIKAQKLLGATISLSNFGTLSGRYATPIIVPPQVAIVGVGRVREEPVVYERQVGIGRVMPLSLSFDHRAASGADA